MRSTPPLTLIAAVAADDVIGRNNALPWHLPADLAHFKRLTLDQTIVMGRRTWDSLPGLLPRRRHIVLSRDPQFHAAGAVVVNSLAAALDAAGAVPEVLIVGGAALYAETLPLAERLCLTRIHAQLDGDAWFPRWDPTQWQLVSQHDHAADERNAFALTFLEWRRLRA
jgi:dihydrofolate reductase